MPNNKRRVMGQKCTRPINPFSSTSLSILFSISPLASNTISALKRSFMLAVHHKDVCAHSGNAFKIIFPGNIFNNSYRFKATVPLTFLTIYFISFQNQYSKT